MAITALTAYLLSVPTIEIAIPEGDWGDWAVVILTDKKWDRHEFGYWRDMQAKYRFKIHRHYGSDWKWRFDSPKTRAWQPFPDWLIKRLDVADFCIGVMYIASNFEMELMSFENTPKANYIMKRMADRFSNVYYFEYGYHGYNQQGYIWVGQPFNRTMFFAEDLERFLIKYPKPKWWRDANVSTRSAAD